MADSIHDKLKRVRKPRVHITYDVETNGAVVEKEIPFVMGVMGDYSGDNTESKKPLKDRKFSQIDRDNFNEVMTKTAPKIDMKVDNTLAGDGSEMAVSLNFNSMEDFEPHKIVDQVEPLQKLMETRNKLRDLLSKADRSEQLETILEDILSDTEAMASLSDELGVGKDDSKDEGDK
ncbi:MAG: type VI secretion system contractile sheath small subunit [Thioalkalispiraceae bacterium]|jgi:type VI secretion system protein ImpB